MHKKHVSILAVLALVAGLAALSVPAQASHQEPDAMENFMPVDPADWGDDTKAVLSDQFDGVDQLAHLTAVATTDADRVLWWVCPAGTAPDTTPYTTDAACTFIGQDTEGQVPVGVDEHAEEFADAAYELFWNIPNTFDGQDVDLFTFACIGEPGVDNEDPEDVPDNCIMEVEEDIYLEDGSDQDQLSSGEIVGICTAPGSNIVDATPNDDDGDNECFNRPSDEDNIPVANRPFKPDIGEHGSNVPADGFTVRFRTSDDVTSADACLWWTADANSGPEDTTDGSCIAATLEQEAVDFKSWVATFDDEFLEEDLEMDLAIFGESASCAALLAGSGCYFDEHYVISADREAAEIVLTWDADNDGVYENQCANPVDEVSNQLEEFHDGYMCPFDQFQDPYPAVGLDDDFTIETEGPEGSEISDCGDGAAENLHDHDGDGRIDHCHVDEDDEIQTGVFWFEVDNYSGSPAGVEATPGDQTLVACHDPEAFSGTEAAPGAGHGCDDETVTSNSIVKHWQTRPEDIELVFYDGGDPETECLTSDKFRENQVGDRDTLMVCTFDDHGNFASTMPAGSGRLQWFIAPSGGGDQTGTRFPSPPPNDTGPDGTETVDIEAFRTGNDIIEVCGQNDPGQDNWDEGFGGDQCSSVQKRVTQGTGSPSPTDGDPIGRGDARGMCNNANAGTNRPLVGGGRLIVGTPGNDVLVGTGGPDIICGLGGNDSIQGRGGNDLLKGGGGNDTIKAGGGDDDVRGGGGHDQLRGGQGDDTLAGGRGNDQIRGGAGNDQLRGGRGHDTLLGGPGSDTMRGARGQDVLRDTKGRGNIFRGGPGNDSAVGRANRGNVYSGIENLQEV